ncbi:MAG: Ig-like domain-containing protein [Myxococcaceae bacterium]
MLLLGLGACGGEPGAIFERELGVGRPLLLIEGGSSNSAGWTGVDFGDVELGTSSSRTLVVRNLGTGTLTLSEPQAWSPFTWNSHQVTSVKPGGRTEVDLGFTPPAEGPWRLILVLDSNAGRANIDLEGNGSR